jgi:hypothetical protein
MNKAGDLEIFVTTGKSTFWVGGLVQPFSPPNPDDLSISTQIFLVG